METLIPAAAYSSLEQYRVEQECLFDRSWQFVGFRSQLAEHEDFLTADIAGRSVIVQNFHGQLHAFQNVCSHRFSRIHQAESGNGPLRCPYHGWMYDAEGLPSCIPQRPRFDGLDACRIRELALARWQVDVCGDLIFVCRRGAESEGDLRSFLGDAYDTVEQMTNASGARLDENRLRIGANWKVLVENTLESYHVGFVHPTTFHTLGAKGADFCFQGPHSSWRAPLKESVNRQWERIAALYESRPFSTDGYFHQFIFPNLTLATTRGASFSIQTIRPVSPAESVFISYVFDTRLAEELSPTQQMMHQMFGDSVVKFNRQVFDEDKAICEQVQLGAAESSQPGLLSDEEERVAHFQRSYRDFLANHAAASPALFKSTTVPSSVRRAS